MTAWGRGQAHIPRRAGGERFVMPSFPAGVCLALPVVCTVLAGSCILFMVSLESATEVRQQRETQENNPSCKLQKMTFYLFILRRKKAQKHMDSMLWEQEAASSSLARGAVPPIIDGRACRDLAD